MKKNTKKIIAFLAIVMMLLMSFTNYAKAANSSGSSWGSNPDHGSLTIHKYAVDDKSAYAGQTGTGETTTPTPKPDEDTEGQLTPLKDVYFTVYKIPSTGVSGEDPDPETGLAEYEYNRIEDFGAGFFDDDDLKAVPATINSNSDMLQVPLTGATGLTAKLQALNTNITLVGTQYTDTNGVTTFDNLDLGRYLVVETAYPNNVNAEMQPFLVDIPTTNAAGTDWIYDVNVYPKNQTAYGAVLLDKIDGQTNYPLSGATFELRKLKVKSTDPNWKTNIDKDDADAFEVIQTANGTNLSLTTNAAGQIFVKDLPVGQYYFIETNAPTGYTLQSIPYAFEVERGKQTSYTSTDVEIDLPDGSSVELEKYTMNDNDFHIVIKNYQNLTFVKSVDKPSEFIAHITSVDDAEGNPIAGSDSEAEYLDFVTYSSPTGSHIKGDGALDTGKYVKWTLTAPIQADIRDYSKYEITDTIPSQLTYADGGFIITVGGAAVTFGAPTVSGNKTTYVSTGNGYTFEVDKTNATTPKITFTINATNASATDIATGELKIELYTVINRTATIGTDITNTATLTYKKVGMADDDTISDSKSVFTAGYKFKKVDKNSNPLGGAEFAVVLATDADGAKGATYIKAFDKDMRPTETFVSEDGTGYVEINGLKASADLGAGLKYYVIETKAPVDATTGRSYNLPKKPIELELVTKTTHEYTEGTTNRTIVNKKGVQLPETGGIGTVVVTGLGLLVIVAGVVLLRKKDDNK